ncbi:hypothetical protein OK074_5147 [Actinobacteria bacterium OK074]|nr:hypothetical protein OK074_5147 [Actinobacteria bacterium OK074]
MTTAFGSLISGILILAHLWAGYRMVLRDHAISGVTFCEPPPT